MSDKTRKKKDGGRKDKKNERMHESVAERKETSHGVQHGPDSAHANHDHGDLRQWKEGSENDRTDRGAHGPTS